MQRRAKRVLLALGWYDYRLHRGIEKYALEHHWHLFGNLAREKVLPWGWEGDGVLAWLGAGDDIADFVIGVDRPTVDFSLRRAHLPFARVLEDHSHAAQLVAEHFLSRGFKHFAFYSDAENWSYEERGQAFRNVLREVGYDCDWLRWHSSRSYRVDRLQWQHKVAWLSEQLRQLSRPLAMFAANDEQALDVLEAANRVGLTVPDEVAIVGAENYLLAPEAMSTPISSVDTNLELLGYRGAALLDQLMKGKPLPKQPLRLPAAGVVTRQSSDLIAVKHRGVAEAMKFLRAHAHERISVDDLARVAAMSRRAVHQAFVDTLGRTPGQELRRHRIEIAKRTLRESTDKIEEIARRCGFQSANSFNVAFKHATSLSPKQFRESTRN